MENEKKQNPPEPEEGTMDEKKKNQEEEIDEELDQTFPASDPPSYSKPGNTKGEDEWCNMSFGWFLCLLDLET